MDKIGIIRSTRQKASDHSGHDQFHRYQRFEPHIFTKKRKIKKIISFRPLTVDPRFKKLEQLLEKGRIKLLYASSPKDALDIVKIKKKWQVPLITAIHLFHPPRTQKERRSLKSLFNEGEHFVIPHKGMMEILCEHGCQLGKILVHREAYHPEDHPEKKTAEMEKWIERAISEHQEKKARIPFFSVIIPTYNRSRSVQKAIRSVLNQTCNDYEIIVVDDGSKDKTKKAVKKFGKQVNYIRQKNSGPSSARNTGIHHARGKYIVFLDSDDKFFRKKLEENKRYLELHPECMFLYSWYQDHHLYNRKKRVNKPKGYKKLKNFRRALYKRKFTIRTSTVVIHRSCFDKVGMFNTRYRYSQDWDMWLRLATHYLGHCQRKSLVQYNRKRKIRNRRLTRIYHDQIRKSIRRKWRS